MEKRHSKQSNTGIEPRIRRSLVRAIGALLAVTMILTGTASLVFAESPASIADSYTVDGITYYKAESDQFSVSDRNFYQDLLATKSDVIGGKSAAQNWNLI